MLLSVLLLDWPLVMNHHDPIINKPYSVYSGIAAENIEKNSTILLVICPELMPNAPFGVVGSGITEETIKLTTRDGKPVTGKITSANHIVATWEGQSNLRYPPAIRKGEPVEVYRGEGQDKYFWRTTGRGRDFRATDRVEIEVGATDPSKPGVTKDDTNTYSAYLDSQKKKVGFKTSKANGEVTAFTMEADLAAGTFYISDDSPGSANRIFIDAGTLSGTPVIQLNLTTGVAFKMEGENLYIKVPDKFLMDVGGRAIFNSPLTIVNNDRKGTLIVNAAHVVFNTAKDLIINAGNVVGINAVSTKIGGVFVAGAARIANAVRGALGSKYDGSKINDPLNSPMIDPTNSADVNVTGTPY